MSARLEALIASAQAADLSWDAQRASRVREGVRRGGEARARRERALRRGLVVAGGAALLVLGLLRAASSAPAEAVASSQAVPSSGALATRMLDDAGYARD